MKKILIAPNSFKETADAVEVSSLFSKYLDKSLFNTVQKPISDGGDGFLDVCNFYFDLEMLNYEISTPYDESYMDCRVGLDRDENILYIESAEVLGLKRIPSNFRHPLWLSSKGFGDLLKMIIQDVEELKFDIEKVIIGVGGTGIMDLGLGMCSRFGLKMYNSIGSELEVLPENFLNAAEIEFQKVEFPFSIELILDVTNPLMSNEGGIIFGKQKGASKAELKVIESGWDKIVKIMNNNNLIDTTKVLNGAGGGLSLGFHMLKNISEIPASEFIVNKLGIGSESDIDMVITGEGAFNDQSLMGKGTGTIISIFEKETIPVVLCCGSIDKQVSEHLSMNVFPIELIVYIDDPINNFEEAIKIACIEISGMTDILTKIS